MQFDSGQGWAETREEEERSLEEGPGARGTELGDCHASQPIEAERSRRRRPRCKLCFRTLRTGAHRLHPRQGCTCPPFCEAVPKKLLFRSKLCAANSATHVHAHVLDLFAHGTARNDRQCLVALQHTGVRLDPALGETAVNHLAFRMAESFAR